MMQELNITEQELVSASNKIYRDNLNEKDKEGAEQRIQVRLIKAEMIS